MSTRARPSGRGPALLLGGQIAALAIALFVPFGFDRPSSLGLDFGHLLVLAAAYLVLLAAGVARAIRLRRWWILATELVLPCMATALVLAGVLRV